MVLVLMNFVVFIHYFINGFRLESILHRATESSWIAAQRLETMNQKGQSDKHTNRDLPTVPPSAYKVLADHSGYLASYKLDAVIQSAKELLRSMLVNDGTISHLSDMHLTQFTNKVEPCGGPNAGEAACTPHGVSINL